MRIAHCLTAVWLTMSAAWSGAGQLGKSPSKHELTISGTRFFVNAEPFPYTGVSFFNAIYNPTFNKNAEERQRWLEKFRKYGINVLRVWCQWDNKRGLADTGTENTMYHSDGQLRQRHVGTLKGILSD